MFDVEERRHFALFSMPRVLDISEITFKQHINTYINKNTLPFEFYFQEPICFKVAIKPRSKYHLSRHWY